MENVSAPPWGLHSSGKLQIGRATAMKVNVLQRFTLLSAGATAVLAVGMALIVSFILSRNLLSREAQVTTDALRVVTNVDLPQEEFDRAVREKDEQTFRYIWGHLQQIPEVFRVKFYDAAGKIVWSDEPRLIGKTYPDDEELGEALRGKVTVEMGAEKTEHEFEKGIAPEAEMLELYVPLLTEGRHSVYGVAEIYKRPTAYLERRRHGLTAVWAGTLGGGLVLFFSLFGLFRSALREQNRLHAIEQRYAAVEAEMKVAGAIQARLLPQTLPEAPGYALAVFHQSHREIGGDYYDAYLLPDGALCMTIADNMGEGIPGALLMADTRMAMAARAGALTKASDVVRAANRALVATAPPETFVTAIFAKLEPGTRRLTYCNAGHPPGMVARGSRISLLDKGGMPLAVEPDEEYDEDELLLEPGDALLLYTDGVVEAMNSKGELFGEERLARVLGYAAATRDPEAILRQVRDAVEAFRAGVEQRDDVAMLCVVVKTAERAESGGQTST
jgi:serine phosphatase RsbU (regulator of sigma subunit)